MTFTQYYQQFVKDCEEFGDDVCHAPGDEAIFNGIPTHQLIDMLVTGKLGVGDVGAELDSRNALAEVPGDNWG